ncbi:phosphatidylserine/phosphatidylglycerophosphate/cardiolipin synthase-like enzyme [Brevundimonas sp. 1080]|uniref:phospholipase D-like domain-containing protein n=1 Tax=Brevundimonas sp. 1080 TaxID=3156405 RepID=UPI0033920A98
MLEAGTTCWRVDAVPRVALLVDMEPYLAAAKAAMENATRSIYFLNWAFDPDTVIDHDAIGEHGPLRIGPFLNALAEARPELDIRILCWQAALPVAATQRFFPLRSRRFFAKTRVSFLLDGSLPLGASHHQKLIVIDDAVAFCGSCDIGPDRWDSPEHLHPDPRRAKSPKGSPCYDCRHEVMAMMDGPAAAALGALFRERWLRATGDELPMGEAPLDDVWPDDVEPDFQNIAVGISRTQAPWKDLPERREGEAAMLAAIAAARKRLYFENQYFTSPIVAAALAQRLDEHDGPEVILVSTQHSPSWFDQMTMDKTRSVFLKRLEDADRYGRFRAYSPVTKDGQTIIVHAKLAIVDDRFVRLGSSNMNNRSEGFDTECDVSFDTRPSTDTSSSTCVAVFRSRLIAHWLGCTVTEVQDATSRSLISGIDALAERGFDRLRPLRAKPLGAVAAFIASHHLGDPISAADSLRPWRRPALMRRKMAETVRRLERANVEAPQMGVPTG